MKITVTLTVCLLLVVIKMSQCAAVFGSIEDQHTHKKDLASTLTEITGSMQNDETILVRHKRTKCCHPLHNKCCCKIGDFQCVHHGYLWRRGELCKTKSGVQARKGEIDCTGCALGWKC